MAITHAELSSLQTHWRTDIGNRIALFLVLLSVLFGLSSFVLCLTAEASRSKQDLRVRLHRQRAHAAGLRRILVPPARGGDVRRARLHAGGSHVSQPPGTGGLAAPRRSTHAVVHRSMATCVLFLAIWREPIHLFYSCRSASFAPHNSCERRICFGIAKELLLIGIGVESGHVSQLRQPKPDCHVIRPVLFAAAGIFGLISVLLGVGRYLTALQTQRLHLLEENMLRDHPHQFPPPEAP
ncbi:hypothetical protein BHE74_00016846 [Ensete ventricosum]|nr:hypothetical protein BHE74_00016846 [Ensete ventricosum]